MTAIDPSRNPEIDPLAPLPALRPLEAFPVTHDGERRIVLRDAIEVAPGVLVVPVPVYYLTAQLDGESTIRDLQADFALRFGELITTEQVADLVRQLDEALFLDTPRFRSTYETIRRTFLDAAVRPAFHAGTAYPDETDAALEEVDGYFTHARGPGPIRTVPRESTDDSLLAVFAPHYDPRRGGFLLAHAFKPLAAMDRLDRLVVLGTNHQIGTELYTATRKPFETPFGRVPVDEAFLDLVEEDYPADLHRDEFCHRREHSVEFQAMMLAYAWRKLDRGEPPPIVPLLVGSFHELHDADPREDERIESLVNGLEHAARCLGGRTIFLAAGDLSHVGPRFGDEEPLSDAFLTTVRQEDRAVMEDLATGGAHRFHRRVSRNQDRYRVCGHSPGYTMLRAVELSAGPFDGETGPVGRIQGYDLATDPDGAVSYCTITFVRRR